MRIRFGKIGAIIAAVLTALGFGSKFILGNDNQIEQISESIVECIIGDGLGEIDFSPEYEDITRKKILEHIEREAPNNLNQVTKEQILDITENKLKSIIG